MRTVRALGVCTALLLLPRVPASAQARPDGGPPGDAGAAVETTPAAPQDGPVLSVEDDDAEREMPDYDGREEETTAGEVLLWIPRVIVAPLYFLAEFVIRRPLGALVTAFEEEEVPSKIVELFTFGPDGETLIVPTALADFGFRPSVGLYFRTRDFLFENHTVLASANFGGVDFLSATLAERYSGADDQWQLQLVGQLTTRADGQFFGLGDENNSESESRYAFDVRKVELSGEGYYWRSSQLSGWAGVRSADFDDDSCCGVDLADRVTQGAFAAAPPGYGGYDIVHFGGRATLDTRPERPAPGSGIRLTANTEYATDFQGGDEVSWIRYGGSVGAYYDVSDWQHVLSLTAWVQFADALHREVPFTEQIDVSESGAPGIRSEGDAGPMRGFVEGRVIGESVIAGVFEYRWPVWIWLDGSLQVAVGNAFGDHLAGFDAGRLRLSAGFGLRTTNSRDSSFDLILGFGTEEFDDGGAAETFRLAIGSTQAF